MAATPQWMYYSRSFGRESGDPGAWEKGYFDVDHSIALENLFTRKDEYPVQYVAHKKQLPLKGTITSSEMDTMLFVGESAGRKVEGRLLRVVDPKALRPGVAYFQDPTFETFSPEASTQIMDAYKFGRVSTAIFVGDDHYAITLRPIPMQTRVATGKVRPIFIPAVPMTNSSLIESMKIYPDDAYNAVTEGLPESLANLLMCPITTVPFRQPVVAADGTTYEYKDICKWLLTSNKSPATGAPLPHKMLYPNLFAYQLITGLIPTEAEQPSSSSSHPKPKKKKRAHTSP